MNVESLLNIVVVLLAVVGVSLLLIKRQRSHVLRRLLVLGLVLRILGSLTYYGILETAYNTADYNRYLREGARVVETVDDPTRPAYHVPDSYGGRWWGTASISILTSWVMRATGTDAIPIMIVFGGISFVAALCFCVGFEHAFPDVNPLTYYTWVMFYPSLWFWPSPLGKDAPVLLGIGLAFLGVVGLHGRRNYLMAAVGVAVTLVVRPQYAIVLFLAVVVGVVLGRSRRGGSAGKVVALAVLSLGGVYLATFSTQMLGFEVTETDETAAWIERRSEDTEYGGSAFQSASNPVMGAVNTLFRPFPWEARGVLVLGSSLEVLGLWVLVYRRRRAIAAFVRRYHRAEAFWISAVFVLALSAGVGMAVGNFGTLARQRIHLYPFLFVIVAAYPKESVPEVQAWPAHLVPA